MLQVLEAECIVDCKDELGEGPLWCTRDSVLYWVDCTRKLVHAYTPGTKATWERSLSGFVGSLAIRDQGGLVVALRAGLRLYDPSSGTETPLPSLPVDFGRERLNDGKVDREGRFWIGSFDRRLTDPIGGIYVLGADHTIARKCWDITVANGIAWSPDSKTMYFCDSQPGVVYQYEYDLARGEIGARSAFLDLRRDPHRPDGCTVDAEGYVWIAQPLANRVARYDPAGKLNALVVVPGARPSSVMFGGEQLDTLYITTMRFGAPPEDLARNPNAGGLFAVVPGVSGLPEPRFAG